MFQTQDKRLHPFLITSATQQNFYYHIINIVFLSDVKDASAHRYTTSTIKRGANMSAYFL